RPNPPALGQREFHIPRPEKTEKVVQAWHPRFVNDPPHRSFRQTNKRISEEVQSDPHPQLRTNRNRCTTSTHTIRTL
ncbi:hypothetical protein ACPTGO_32210, partial [Pseudomonas aeruginosa]